MVDETKLSKTFYIAFSATIFTLVLLIACLFIVTKNTNLLIGKKQNLTVLNNDLEKLDLLLAQRPSLEKKIEKISKSLPSSYNQVASVVQTLEQISQNSGLETEFELDQYAVAEFDSISSIRIQIKASGNYGAYQKFLQAISELPVHIRIDRIQMDGESANITSSITLRLFIVKNEKI